MRGSHGLRLDRLVREVHVQAAAHADLVVEHDQLAAARALPAHLVLLEAVENGEISEARYVSYLGILNGEEMDWKAWEIK